MSGEPIALLIIVAGLALLLGAMLSAGEAATQWATRAGLTEAGGDGGLRLRRALRLIEDPAATGRSLSFVRVIAEVTTVACLTLIVADWLEPWWQVLIAALFVSILIALVVVRASPRSVGRRYPARVLFAFSGPLTAVVRMTRWLGRPVPVDAHEREREFQEMVEKVGESEAIEEEDRELLRSVFELGDTVTREVMVPRTDMVTVPRETTIAKVLALFVRSGFSRIPVTGRTTDELLGVVYFKDAARVAMPHAIERQAELSRPVSEIARAAFFVPESKPVDDLLREMQASSSHIAMVVDEYGGIAGLVTIEDALEEIVGELTDEHDPPVQEVEDLGGGVYRVPARLGVEELGDLFDLDLDDDDVDTAGGLLAKALGKVPLPGSSATIAGLCLVADRAEGRRKKLATVLASRAEEPDDDHEAGHTQHTHGGADPGDVDIPSPSKHQERT